MEASRDAGTAGDKATAAGAGLEHYPADPLVPITLNVGVTGHRPRQLGEAGFAAPACRAVADDVLACVQAVVARLRHRPRAAKLYRVADPAVLRVISPLAEGADRWIAEAAVARGFELVAPLPFEQRVYEEDFAPSVSQENPALGTLDGFRDLLAAAAPGAPASRVVELDGDGRDRATAYALCGRFVARHADLMIAVWDGAEPEESAGTGVTVADAYREGVPIVWIVPGERPELRLVPIRPYDGRVLDDVAACREVRQRAMPLADEAGKLLEQPLERAIGEVLLPERFVDAGEKCLDDFARERGIAQQPEWPPDLVDLYGPAPLALRRRWPGPLAKIFATMQRLLATDGAMAHRRPPRKLERHQLSQPFPLDPAPPAIHRILAAYLRTDQLANHYAGVYRSLYVVLYLSVALALCCAVGALFFGKAPWLGLEAKYWLTGVELVLLVVIIGLVVSDHGLRIQERWIDYRLLAELFRPMLFLPLVGESGSRRQIRLRAREAVDFEAYREHEARSPEAGAAAAAVLDDHSSSDTDDPPSPRAWTFLYFETVIRHAGVVGARFEPMYLQHVRDYAACSHVGGQLEYHATNAARAEVVAHRLATVSEVLFGATIIAVLVKLASAFGAPEVKLAGLLTGVLPALGAASYAIRSHAEFDIVSKRSRSMWVRLSRHLRVLESSPLHSVALASAMRSAADTMVRDVADWKDILEEKETEAG